MTEINDYAPALLKIKAAIKELEALLPAGKADEAEEIAAAAMRNFGDLRCAIVGMRFKKMKQAA